MLEMDYRERISLLIKLRDVVRDNEKNIMEALYQDLGKCAYEAYESEIALIYNEINYTLKYLKSWMQEKTLPTPVFHMPAVSTVIREPYGRVLIIAPWNFPFQLTLIPLVNAWAAGNVVTIKPSELAIHSEQLINRMITDNFHTSRARVETGGPEVTMNLLDKKFDMIFYCGSQRVGKIVYTKAAAQMTPVILQTGGKTPVIIDEDYNIAEAARRIVFGKFLNCGQNSLAPEYVLVSKKNERTLIKYLEKFIHDFYGENPMESEDYGKIVNKENFLRLMDLIEHQTIVSGGDFDLNENKIEPTIVRENSLVSEMMKNEIFGPILPILTYSSWEQGLEIMDRFPNPPACYVFTKNRLHREYIKNNFRCGSMCINDTLIQATTTHLPIGGVGGSGIGKYHGKAGYDTFSNIKGIMSRMTGLEVAFRYPPHKNHNFAVLKRLLKTKG